MWKATSTAIQSRMLGVLGEGAPGGESGAERLDLARGRFAGGDALGRKPRRQPVEGGADAIEIADAARFHRRHLDPALAAVDHQALAAEQLQRMADRLARDRKALGDVLLRQPLAGRQRAVGDRVDQPGVDLLDQVGNWRKRFHGEFRIRHSEFRIQ